MSCSCGQNIQDVLDALAPLKEIGVYDNARAAVFDLPKIIASSHQHLRKAERAAKLGLADEVAAFHREAALRESRRARILTRNVRAELQERFARDDWEEIVARAGASFQDHGGTSLLDDLRTAGRDHLYSLDVSGEDAAEALAAFDEVIQAGREGLPAVLQLIDRTLGLIEEQRDLPRLGQEPASPLSLSAWVCILAAGGMVVFAFFVCGVTGPAWPLCFFGTAGIAALIIIFGCLTLR